VVVPWPKDIPAKRLRPKNDGSSIPKFSCFSILLEEIAKFSVWPLPKKLRSLILNVNTVPSEELYPAPIPSLPVGF
jgi:hypothetical protein